MQPSAEPVQTSLVETELFRITERSLRAAPPDEEGFVSTRAAGAFDVVVGTASMDRALEAIRLLLEQAGQAGIRVTVDAQARKTLIQVGDELLPIRLRDRRRQIKHRLTADDRETQGLFAPRWDYVPSGDLSLQVDAPTARNAHRCWALGGASRLPHQVAKCLRALPKIGEAKKAAAIEAERREREWAERRQREAEAERRRREEQHRRDLLLKEAMAWRQCQTLRGYIEGMRARFSGQRESHVRAELERWLTWATSVADSLDPVLDADRQRAERATPDR
jgi:hypothetical protein